MSARFEEHPPAPERLAGPVLALVGPTGSGKSAVAVDVAERLNAEIVCVDSMTVYRGMDVGTAKPPAADRRRVPHHMLDIAEPSASFTVHQFQGIARAAVAAIHSRGRIPLLVGGSGLYFRAVVDDLAFPPVDPGIRARLQHEDPSALAARLKDADPRAAGAIDGPNLRRIVRALEVLELTGRPFSEFRETWDAYRSRYPLTVAGIFVPPPVLAARIDERTRRMYDSGLIEETRGLLDAGFRTALTASRAIGYREAVGVLDGVLGVEEAIASTAAATRRYARRQRTWFRKDPRVRWVEGPSVEAVADVFEAAGNDAERRPRAE